MSDTATAPAMIRRFVKSDYAPDDYTYDIIWTDRLTGRVVLSYDGADPAYGAKPDSDYLASCGHDINAEIEIGQSVIPVPAGEAEMHASMKERKALRDQEEAESLDLLEFLGTEVEAFDFEEYSAGERKLLKPALEKRGYTSISFYMIEQDSFGPLIRGCVANCHCGKRVRFAYG
jgi:hypothetical protein